MTEPLKQRVLKRDRAAIVPQAQCPGCGTWGDCDPDQISGDVSIVCPICGWHGYIDGREA